MHVCSMSYVFPDVALIASFSKFLAVTKERDFLNCYSSNSHSQLKDKYYHKSHISRKHRGRHWEGYKS